ncbi:tyrosine-type recombinase/integrase [Fodinicola acaciae]|uniref:tyrosine-type recombinase/integrase n=1 Tax=Fodinicola acaciae TaxID=2681555 RepID=UPI0013D599DC|nr:site-specific integrase [Fodinicola acaciae]
MANTRRPNGSSSIYLGKNGNWHGRVTVGVKDNGKPDRRHIERKTQASVIKAVRQLEKERDAGRVRKPGKLWTVAEWLTHWVETIAATHVRENTLAGYRVAVNIHLIPGIGAHRLAKLEPEHLEKLYARMMRNGSAAGTAHQAHRTIRTALNEAMRRGHVTRNVATLAKAPRPGDVEVEPYSVDEVKRLLEAAGRDRNSARWAVALALGLRQGEALGLKWSDVDLETGTLVVRRARQRPRWKHGCVTPCGKKFGGYCPDRRPLRTETADTKSRAGRRSMGLPDALIALLRTHRAEQEAERAKAGQLWTEGGWLFATPTGGPLNPRTDWSDWKRLVARAGLRDARLHDARHTAATVLLILGVSDRAVMGIMGWSDSGMAKRYQHITAPVRQDIARRVGAMLWSVGESPGTETERAS